MNPPRNNNRDGKHQLAGGGYGPQPPTLHRSSSEPSLAPTPTSANTGGARNPVANRFENPKTLEYEGSAKKANAIRSPNTVRDDSHLPAQYWNYRQAASLRRPDAASRVHPAPGANQDRYAAKMRAFSPPSAEPIPCTQYRSSPVISPNTGREGSSQRSPSRTGQGQVGIDIRPETRENQNTKPRETNEPSVPILSGRLVSDGPRAPVYDAVAVASNGTAPNDDAPWWKRHRHILLAALILTVFGLLAAVMGVLISSQKKDPTIVDNIIEPDNRESTKESALRYYADPKNNRCDDDPAERPSPELRQRFYETLMQCCNVEFAHLEDKECIRNSLLPDPSTTPTSTSPSLSVVDNSTVTTPLATSTTTLTTRRPTTSSTTRTTSTSTTTARQTSTSTSTSTSTGPTSTRPTINLDDWANVDWTATTRPTSFVGSTPCSEELVTKLEDILMTDGNYGSHNPTSCKCASTTALGETADNIFSCTIQLDEECSYYFCNDGWQCVNPVDTVVHVCFVHTYEDQYQLDASFSLKYVATVHTLYFTKGVSNVKSRTITVDRTTEPASCYGLSVNGQACLSCDFCEVSNETITTVADCSNVVENAAATCEEGEFLKALLVLDSQAINDPPTPSTAQDPTDSPFDITSLLQTTTPNALASLVWHQQGQAIAGENALDESGNSVALSSCGCFTAIGAPGPFNNTDRRGYARVFERIVGDWMQLGQTINGQDLGDLLGWDVDLSSDGKMLAVGAPGSWQHGDRPGYVKVFRLVEQGAGGRSSWQQLGQTINGETNGDQAGISVSLSSNGKVVAIGANSNNGVHGIASGRVQVYEYSQTTGEARWNQLGQNIDGEAPYDSFGKSVSLSEDGMTLAVGAPLNDGNGMNSGSVRVYRLEGNVWSQLGRDLDGKAAWDRAGHDGAVALSPDGKVLVVGAPNNTYIGADFYGTGSGNARVFGMVEDHAGLNWKLGKDFYGEVAGDYFGISAAISKDGTVVAIGASGNDGNGGSSGHVKLFYLDGDGTSSSWKQLGMAIEGQAAGDNSGVAVDLSADGRTVVIGSVWNDDGGDKSGHVRVFHIDF